MADQLLDDLDDAQRRAVTSPARPLAILAPAGSGKTRVLTRRIAWRVEAGDADASHVLALTFTRKAAGELDGRLRALGLRSGVATGTFHGVAYAQLRSWWADHGQAAPGLLARKAPVLAAIVSSSPLSVAQLAGEIEWAKARLVGPDGYAEATAAARRRPPTAAERVAELYRAYEDDKRRARMVDFDDLLRLCGHLVETDAAFAAAQRWRFQHLFVDEFQDVNPLQLRLLDAWRGDRYDLCVVGDPHQAIYGWNGADAGFLQGFRRLYPPAEVISLVGNYRSTPQVLAAATDVLTRAGAGESQVTATRVAGPDVRLERHQDERAEAQAIARAVRDRRGPRAAWSSQAVLVRTHAQVPVITEALRRTGVPHHLRGADTVVERREVREALDLLRRSGGPLTTCLPDLAALADEAEGEAGADLDLVVQLAHDHLRLDPGAGAGGFVSWLVATLQAESGEARRDAVTVATFHSAKGLEWPVVHLAGLEDGLVPITHARTQAQRAEEARLLYVAMTRAEDELHCSWAASRSFGGKPAERRLTPWLAGLAERQRARQRQRARGGRRRPGARVARAPGRPAGQPGGRGGGPRPSGPVPALAALHAWRDESARAARADPAALIDDRLLEAIAERVPATREELAAVPGMGPLLAARVADGLLAALQPHTAS